MRIDTKINIDQLELHIFTYKTFHSFSSPGRVGPDDTQHRSSAEHQQAQYERFQSNMVARVRKRLVQIWRSIESLRTRFARRERSGPGHVERETLLHNHSRLPLDTNRNWTGNRSDQLRFLPATRTDEKRKKHGDYRVVDYCAFICT